MKIRSCLSMLVAALAVPLAALLAHSVIQDLEHAERNASALLSMQAEIIATNTSARLTGFRERLDSLASLPAPALLDPARCEPSLQPLLALHPEYTNILTFDVSGAVVCSALPIPQGAPPSAARMSWFQRILKERRYVVGEPFFGPIARQQVLVMGVPLPRDAGQSEPLLGAAAITIPIRAFDPTLPRAHLPPEIRYGLINSAGALVWRNEDAGELGTQWENEASQRMREVRDGLFEATAGDGVRRRYAVKSMPEFGLIAFVGLPAEGIQAEARHAAVVGAILSGTVICVLLLFAMAIARRIERALEALGRAALAVEAGSLDTRMPVDGPHEVARLAATFNGMLDTRKQADELLRRQAAALEVSERALVERMKELSCLYDVSNLAERGDLDTEAMLEAVADRLPAALRFPSLAVAAVAHAGRCIGQRPDGPSLCVDFVGARGEPGSICVAYTGPLPEDAGEPFIDEERMMLEAIAARVESSIRRAEAAAADADNRALLEAVIDKAPLAIELADAQTLQFMAVNDASCNLLGYTREEMLSLSVTDIQGALEPEQVAALTHDIAAAGSAEFSSRHRRKDGRLIDVHVNVNLIRQKGRDYFVGIWRDTTAENEALVQIRMLSLAVEQSPNAVLITDLQANIVYVNRAFCQISGYRRDEVIGNSPRILRSGKTPQSTYENLWEAILAGTPWRGEFINRAKDGREFHESALIVPLRDESGAITNFVAVKEDVTARRHTEERLRKLQLAVDQSPESIVITNLDAQIEYVNHAFTRNTGYSLAEAQGLNPRVLKSGRTPAGTYEEMWATLTSGRPWRGILYNRRKDGSDYIEMANISPIRQPDGEVTHYLAIKEDITEKQRMAEELEAHRNHLERLVEERSAELLRTTQSLTIATQEQLALFDAATVGFVFVRERRIIRCNRTLEQMFGYAPGEMLGQITRSWYADDDTFAEVGLTIASTIDAGGLYSEERELRRKDGSRFWGLVSARAIDRDDLSKGLAGIVADVTEQHQAREALKRTNEQQQAIFDTASSGIALLRDRIIVRGNRRLHELFGWPEGAMIGQATAIWYPDMAADAAGNEPVYAQIWRGEISRRDQQLMRKDGSLFWARLAGLAVDINDPDQGTVWVIDDISAERTAIDEMRRAQELAEAAVRMKSDFLANMSHEIRTPMNAIIGMSHLVMKTELTPRQRDYLKKIQSSSKHLLSIINDILDLSKIEAGKLVVEHIEFELDSVLENVCGLVAERAAAKGLELILDVAKDVPRSLVGDPLRLGQVLINYANNAVKFTDHGEVMICVTLAEASADDVLLHFAVTDTGIGIDEAQRGRLFRSFEQADSSTTRKFGGTGLGLSIARQVAELMGGAVGVDSELGKGSTFWFTARLGRGLRKPLNLLPDPDLRGRRVLVVDDNENARAVISQMLQSMTFAVAQAAAGREAVGLAESAAEAGEAYEVVFLDWQMPGIDGIQTAREIRAALGADAPHLVMITAYGRDDVLRAAAEVGIEDLLIKPVTASILFDTVMRVIAGAHRDDGHVRGAEAPPAGLSAITGARILLVEDNDLNQEVATELLRDAGFVVDVAENGAVALDMLDAAGTQTPYDLVLMDMQMPVMDGVTATMEIRKQPQWHALPVVAMTANAMAGDRERCLLAGMNDHVAKPIDPEVLWDTIRRWVPARRRSDPASEHPPCGSAPSGMAQLPAASLAAIPGVDTAAGVRLALGRQELYQSLLGKFVAGQGAFSERMQQALAAGDRETAARLAHTLKGVSAQIGAAGLSRLAQALEHSLHGDETGAALDALTRNVYEELEGLIKAINQQLPAAGPAGPSADTLVDRDALGEVCRKLAGELASYDFSSVTTIETHQGLLRAAFAAEFERVAALAQEFNFRDALSTLEAAAAKSNISLQQPAGR